MAKTAGRPSNDEAITIKKYANRRLYNTATSSYVTLDFLAEMVKGGEEFVVKDAKTGDDITRSVLTQIIFEEEGKGEHLLPISFLRKLIGLYGDNLQSFVPSYLEMSMEAFSKNQEAMKNSMAETMSGGSPFKVFEDVARQNMTMFEQGMKMFGGGIAAPGFPTHPTERTADPSEIESLRAQVEELKKQLKEKSSA